MAFQRIFAVLLVLTVALVGCGGKHDSASTHAGQGASESVPADPAESAGDAAQIDQQCPTSNTKSFAKTKFVLHSGLAFGAFHRWLYKPFKAGTFNKGADGRIKAFVKGGLAALFVKREIRLATEDVKASPALCKAMIKPLAKVGDTVKSAFDKLKSGDSSAIEDLNSTISSAEATSKSNGVEIQEDENADLKSTPK